MSQTPEMAGDSGSNTGAAALLEPLQSGGVSVLEGDLVVAIDGPAGTGKSTVSRLLAARLGVDFLDTGAMYRAAATVVIDEQLPLDDHEAIVRAVEAANIRFDWTRDPPDILAHDRSVAHRIRQKDVTSLVSPLAAIRSLRTHMVRLQREIAADHPRLVTEGRDQGSVVFPRANVKIYLTASARVRATRRADQLRAEGRQADEDQLLRDITARDESDMSRADGPLRCPADAVVLDTSTLNRDEVVDAIESIVRGKGTGPSA